MKEIVHALRIIIAIISHITKLCPNISSIWLCKSELNFHQGM